jgi:hypothetical protein
MGNGETSGETPGPPGSIWWRFLVGGNLSDTKESNPKDIVGSVKAPMSTVSAQVMGEVGLGMLEGALKYGRHNYRAVGVRASIYYDGTMRHLQSWWEGEDIDPDSGISHVSKAIASLMVLRDSMLQENWDDDRPPKVKNQNWVRDLNAKAAALIAKYPEPKPSVTAESEKSKLAVMPQWQIQQALVALCLHSCSDMDGNCYSCGRKASNG